MAAGQEVNTSGARGGDEVTSGTRENAVTSGSDKKRDAVNRFLERNIFKVYFEENTSHICVQM